MTMHTYTPQPMSLSGVNFFHVTVSELKTEQDIKCQGHYSNVKG